MRIELADIHVFVLANRGPDNATIQENGYLKLVWTTCLVRTHQACRLHGS